MNTLRERQKRPARVYYLSEAYQMVNKLAWEIDQLKKAMNPDNEDLTALDKTAYIAFNSAVTAWHIGDWVWDCLDEVPQHSLCKILNIKFDSKGNNFLNYLDATSTDLNICHSIANGSKHRGQKAGVEAQLQWDLKSVPVPNQTGISEEVMIYKLVVNYNGKTLNGVIVFENALKFWRDFLRRPEFQAVKA